MTLTRATTAFERNKFSEAAAICLDVLDHEPTSVPAVLLLSRALLAGGSFMSAITAAAAPKLDPKLAAKAGPYADQIEDVLVDSILGWADAIESGQAPKADRKSFVEATTFYAENYDRFITELIGLERAIVKKVPVGDTFREMVEAKRGAKPKAAKASKAAKATAVTKPVKLLKPAKPVKAAKPTKGAKSAKPTKAAKPASRRPPTRARRR